MAIELFLAQMVGDGSTATPYCPPYVRNAAVERFGGIRYSRTGACVLLLEATQTYLNSVAAQPDVIRLATQANIDSTLTANQANAAKTVFESYGIPSGFVNAGDTRRQVTRTVIGLFLFSQRLEGRFGKGFWQLAQERNVTLETTWADLPQAAQTEFIETRDSFGWEGNLGVTSASTLRQIMRILTDQFAGMVMEIAGVAI